MILKKRLTDCIIAISSIFLFIALVLFIYGLLIPNEGDPYTGSYDVSKLDSGWILTIDGEEGSSYVTLPVTRNDLVGKTVHLKRNLPEDISDGMDLCVRSSMNDTYIYVNGRIRSSYSTNSYYNMSHHLPSAYIFCDLSAADASTEVDLKIFMKSTGAINSVIYGYSGNIYYNIHENNRYIVFVGYIMLFIGLITIMVYIGLSRRSTTPGYLLFMGELSVALGLWLLSETLLRQWIFASQAPTGIYAYLTIESVPILACLYFDSVQERRFHKYYRICEILSLSVLVINSLLSVTGLCDFYKTLIFSHVFSGIAMIVSVSSIVSDIIHRRIRNYMSVFIGIVLFMLSCLIELINYYINRLTVLGLYMAIGIIILLFFTIIQMVVNESKRSSEQLKDQERFALRTLEALAGSIDAREEYTGGHSYRVAEYASRLAAAVASRYHFTEEDIKEIHYIGIMHDLGKIALPDSILNCPGKLTEEEFSLVKQHVIIGEQLLKSLKHTKSLLDGVRYHHERYDGTGYPDGLSGEEIPVIARILAIADSYDAMTSRRIFREPLTCAMAKAEIISCSGSQFDPVLAEVFCDLIDKKIIFPIRSEGIEEDPSGVPLQSAILQLNLRNNILGEQNETIKEPSHIRTACFIIGVAEKNNSKVDIYLAGLSDVGDTSSGDRDKKLPQIKDFLNRSASPHDMILNYTDDKLLLIYIDRKDSDIADILSGAAEYALPDELSFKRISLT